MSCAPEFLDFWFFMFCLKDLIPVFWLNWSINLWFSFEAGLILVWLDMLCWLAMSLRSWSVSSSISCCWWWFLCSDECFLLDLMVYNVALFKTRWFSSFTRLSPTLPISSSLFGGRCITVVLGYLTGEGRIIYPYLSIACFLFDLRSLNWDAFLDFIPTSAWIVEPSAFLIDLTRDCWTFSFTLLYWFKTNFRSFWVWYRRRSWMNLVTFCRF